MLIPKYSSIGACIATILAEFLVMFYQSWTVKKELKLIRYMIDSIGFFIKAIIMFIIILVLGNNIDNIIIKIILQIIIGGIVYIVLNSKYIYNLLKSHNNSLNKRKVIKHKYNFEI